MKSFVWLTLKSIKNKADRDHFRPTIPIYQTNQVKKNKKTYTQYIYNVWNLNAHVFLCYKEDEATLPGSFHVFWLRVTGLNTGGSTGKRAAGPGAAATLLHGPTWCWCCGSARTGRCCCWCWDWRCGGWRCPRAPSWRCWSRWGSRAGAGCPRTPGCPPAGRTTAASGHGRPYSSRPPRTVEHMRGFQKQKRRQIFHSSNTKNKCKCDANTVLALYS